MVRSSRELIGQYLREAISAEEKIGTQLRKFAADSDDEDVQASFALCADEAAGHVTLLSARLQEFGSALSDSSSPLTSLSNLVPRLASIGAIIEERTLQNLLIAYTIEAGECAFYEALATVAQAAGELPLAVLARQIQAEKQHAAETFVHFIPTRSKIAFNMLTVTDVDPSVETKAAGDRLLQD